MLSYDIAADYKINPETQGKASLGDYNEYFKKDSLQTVYIEIDSDNLNYMFQNAGDKPTVMAKSITIGDKTVEYVGLKTI